MYLGKKVRLERIINRKNGRTIIVPMDHGVTVGVMSGLIDMRETVNDMANGGADAVLMHKGLIGYGHRQSGKDVGLIMHLSASTDLSPTKNTKVLVIDDFLAMGEALRGVTEIVKQSGAELIGIGAAVSVALFIFGETVVRGK